MGAPLLRLQRAIGHRGRVAEKGCGGSGDTPSGPGPQKRASAACSGPGSKLQGATFTLNQHPSHPSLTATQSESFQVGVLNVCLSPGARETPNQRASTLGGQEGCLLTHSHSPLPVSPGTEGESQPGSPLLGH